MRAATPNLVPAPERRRPRKGEERRSALLAALEQLLEDHPLSGISVEEITAKAGVTRPAFYFYFQTKAAAAAALIRGLYSDMIASTTAFFEVDAGTPRERLHESLSSGAQAWHRHGKLVCALFDAAAADPDIRVTLDSWTDEFIGFTATRIEEERAAGRAPDGVPAAALATVLVNMNLRSFERDARNHASTAQIEQTVYALVDVWATALYRDLG